MHETITIERFVNIAEMADAVDYEGLLLQPPISTMAVPVDNFRIDDIDNPNEEYLTINNHEIASILKDDSDIIIKTKDSKTHLFRFYTLNTIKP